MVPSSPILNRQWSLNTCAQNRHFLAKNKDVQKADYLRVVAIFWTIVLIESIANKAIKSLVATFFLFVNEATEKG